MRVLLIAGTASALLIATGATAAVPPGAPPSRPPVATAAAPPAASLPQVLISGDKLTRAVDCAGAPATIAASDGAVTLKHCLGIVVMGSHERVTADLMVYSSILVLGDHDVVRWTASPGVSPDVRDQGHGNVMAPL